LIGKGNDSVLLHRFIKKEAADATGLPSMLEISSPEESDNKKTILCILEIASHEYELWYFL
jgi:hypothetical protein